jgi:DNA-directed RNA polymerase III subunit RPC8
LTCISHTENDNSRPYTDNDQTTIQDLIQIKPQDFHKPSAQAIKDVVNEKYSNKIVPGVGLCICMWDLLSSTEGLIGHGTGLVNVNIEFRMSVFRPFRGEIIYGRIKSSNEEGITLDLDFTSEVFVPYQNLFESSSFSNAENVWVWNSDGTELFLDKGEPVLFRVEQEEWIDQRPTIVQKDEAGNVIEERGTAWRVIVSTLVRKNIDFINSMTGLNESSRVRSHIVVGRARRGRRRR